MTATFLDEAYAGACARTAYILLKRPEKEHKTNERHLLWHYTQFT